MTRTNKNRATRNRLVELELAVMEIQEQIAALAEKVRTLVKDIETGPPQEHSNDVIKQQRQRQQQQQ